MLFNKSSKLGLGMTTTDTYIPKHKHAAATDTIGTYSSE